MRRNQAGRLMIAGVPVPSGRLQAARAAASREDRRPARAETHIPRCGVRTPAFTLLPYPRPAVDGPLSGFGTFLVAIGPFFFPHAVRCPLYVPPARKPDEEKK